jgi:hypothetical protein
MTKILTPDCPVCGEPPLWVLGGGTQAFCGSDECPVFTWNPAQSREHFMATAREVQITQDQDGSDEGSGENG